jgi:hypothetical protein
MSTSDSNTPKLLDDWQDINELAAEFSKSPRTIKRWTKGPDGLPFAYFGDRQWFYRPKTREWMLGRLHKPNPRREQAA